MPDLHTSTYNRTDPNKWWLLILAAFSPLKHTPEVTAITETFGRLSHLMTITGILEGKGTLRAGQTAMQLQTLLQPESSPQPPQACQGRWTGGWDSAFPGWRTRTPLRRDVGLLSSLTLCRKTLPDCHEFGSQGCETPRNQDFYRKNDD